MSESPHRQLLVDVAHQFAYEGGVKGKTHLHTGGLSVLEDVFEALGWPDPIEKEMAV